MKTKNRIKNESFESNKSNYNYYLIDAYEDDELVFSDTFKSLEEAEDKFNDLVDDSSSNKYIQLIGVDTKGDEDILDEYCSAASEDLKCKMGVNDKFLTEDEKFDGKLDNAHIYLLFRAVRYLDVNQKFIMNKDGKLIGKFPTASLNNPNINGEILKSHIDDLVSFGALEKRSEDAYILDFNVVERLINLNKDRASIKVEDINSLLLKNI